MNEVFVDNLVLNLLVVLNIDALVLKDPVRNFYSGEKRIFWVELIE